MRTIMSLVVAAFLLAAWTAPPAVADSGPTARGAEDHVLTVTNTSPRTIVELRVSSARDDDWGDDRLGDSGMIQPGHAFTLHLPGRDCTYDVQAKYDDGKLQERRGVDICRTRQLALDGSGAAAPAAPPTAAASATLLNGTPRTMTEIYVSPASADDWGSDRLGQDQLPAGRSVSVSFAGGCRQDVRVVYDNKSAEERRGVDLCVHSALRITPGWALLPELDAPEQPAPDGGNEGGAGGGHPGGGAGGGGDDHIRYLRPAPSSESAVGG